MINLLLKREWDYPTNYDPRLAGGVFSGRQAEKNQLVNELLRKESGSILVSGVRGVGKTSVVYEALKEATIQDPKIFPIIINASQLELATDNPEKISSELADKVLRNLIRRMYSRLDSEGTVSEALEKLYKKAVSTEVNITEESLEETSDDQSSSDTETKQLSLEINKQQLVMWLSVFLGFAVTFSIPPIPDWGSANKLLGLILISLPPFTFRWTQESIKKIIKASLSKKSAREIYQSDNSLSNIEYDLNQFLEKFKAKKIVFVIDELDKIEDKRADLITGIIRTFKNLFNLSSALFLFITNEATYKTIMGAKKDKTWDYTLFPTRLYLNKPEFEDLKKFFADVTSVAKVDDSPIENIAKNGTSRSKLIKDSRYKDFVNLLCFRSENDFFEFRSLIRDYIVDFDKKSGSPIIRIDSLSPDDKLRARLQEIIIQIYKLNSFRLPSDWHLNDAVISHLYSFVGSNFNKNFNLDMTGPISDGSQTDDRIITKQNKSIRDLISMLLRLKIISQIQPAVAPPNVDESGKPVDVRDYQWTGTIPDTVPHSFSELFDKEKAFMSTLHEYVNLVNQIDDISLEASGQEVDNYNHDEFSEDFYQGKPQESTGIDVVTIYSKFSPLKDRLGKQPPEHIPDDELEVAIGELTQEMAKLRNNSKVIVESAVKTSLNKDSELVQAYELADDPTLFSSNQLLRDAVTSSGLQHSLLVTKDPSRKKQILFLFNAPPEMFTDEIKKNMDDSHQEYLVVNCQTIGEYDYSKVSQIQSRRGLSIRKRPTRGFINIQCNIHFKNVRPAVKKIVRWFSE